MKKLIILSFLATLFQISFSQTIKYGISAGVNYNTVIIDNFFQESPDYKIGFQINAILEKDITNEVALRFEPGFVNRGFTEKHDDAPDNEVNLNYLSIPLLIKYTPIDNLSFFMGPELAYRLSATGTRNEKTYDLAELYQNEFDLGINTGASYLVMDKLELGFRYYIGLISISSDSYVTDAEGNRLEEDATFYNQGFAFSVAYMIN